MNMVLTAVYTCGNMLTVSSEDGTVNILHSSLVDFLSDESSPIHQDPRLARFIIRAAQADSDIANFCIAYLESGCCNEGPICLAENAVAYNQRLTQYPFMPYAASFWPDHLRDSGNPYLNLSSPFFQSKSKVRKNWWYTYWGFSTGKDTWLAPMNFTLLHLASYLDLVCIAQQMLQRGDLQARIDKTDSHGSTALDYAVVRGHMQMFRFLIGVGASQKSMNETLLELACRKGQRDIAASLIDMGYNVNVRAQTTSAKESVYLMTRWLPGVISEGLELNRDAWSLAFRDIGDQETPLAQAATYGHSAVVELLLDRGAFVDAGTTKGFTPLHAASYQGQTECVELLIKRGATVMAQTTDQWLALHFAALRGKLPVVEIFLNMGVPLDSMTIKSKTALHFAAYSGHAEVVQALVERGANLELRSHKGETPLHLATRHRKPQVVELLLSLGANRGAVTNEGKTPFHLAQASTTMEGKECLRILQTFGMDGYQPWQPPADPDAAAAIGTVPAANVDATTGSTHEPPRKDSAKSAPTQRSFAPVVAPVSYPIQGFQAKLTLNGQYQASQPSPANMYTPIQSMNQSPASVQQWNQGPPPNQPMNQWYPPTQQPPFNRVQSDPTYGPSRFTYDPSATMQNFQGQQYPQDDPPPLYAPPAAGSGFQMPSTFPEKSPSATMPVYTSNQSTWQNPSSAQPSNAPSAAPVGSHSQYNTPTTAYIVPTMTPTVAQQPCQASLVQMMNFVSLNPNQPPSAQVSMTPMTPNQAPAQPTVSVTTSSYSQPGYFGIQTPSTSIPAIQTPISPISPPVHPATAPAATPFQPPSPLQPPPAPQFQQIPHLYPTQHQYQTSLSPQQLQQYQTTQQSFQTACPPSPFLTPQPHQQSYSPQPIQSAQFAGNTTASTYNAAYEYSAPAVAQPWNPGLGTNANGSGNGMVFAPPPTEGKGGGKRKGFLQWGD
jgi:ankyrin repeat protein